MVKIVFEAKPEQDQKLDAISAALTAEYGIKVSRAATLRKLIDTFILPHRSPNGSTITCQTADPSP